MSWLLLLFVSLVATRASEPLTELSLPFLTLVDGLLRGLDTGNNVSDVCQSDVGLLLQELDAGQDWAIRMVDSVGKPNNGMAEGGLSLIGSFSECVDAATMKSNSSETVFKGKYCLTLFSVNSSKRPQTVSRSVWKTIRNRTVELAVCVPSTCSVEDLSSVMERAIFKVFPNTTISQRIENCHIRGTSVSASPGVIVMIFFLGFFLLLGILGTLYDITQQQCKGNGLLCRSGALDVSTSTFSTSLSTEQLCQTHENKDKLWAKLLLAFSVRENGKKILVVGNGASSIEIFHGMRFLSMVWIVIGHSFSFALTWLKFRNPGAMQTTTMDFSSQIFANGTFSVDTFFYLSGFLVTFVSMKVLKKTGGRINVPMFIFHRYIRMTPLMMVIIGFCATLLRYVGNGPAWLSTIMMYDSWCQKNWWINALYLQNFIDTPNMCLSHSWYSAVDMQFFIISPLFLYLLYRNRWLGLSVLFGTFLLSIGITAYISAVNHFPAIPYVGNVVPQALVDDYSGQLYIKPYCRIGPYLIGLAMGYFVHSSQGAILIKKKYVLLGWILGITANLSVLYSTWPAYQGEAMSNAGSTTYSSLARSVWALGLSWLTFACIAGYGGFVTTILSWKAFVPLSRLTYCAYLIHPVVMAVFYGSREMSFDYSIYMMLYFLMGNLVISYAVSFVLSVFFESPFIALEKALLKKA